MRQDQVVEIIVKTTEDLLGSMPNHPPIHVDEKTVLIGEGGIIDSLNLVSLILDVEEYLEERMGLSVILADERAISRERSPFRTIEALADYVWELTEEDARARS